MVRHDDAVHPGRRRAGRILRRHNALEHERKAGSRAQPVDHLPGQHLTLAPRLPGDPRGHRAVGSACVLLTGEVPEVQPLGQHERVAAISLAVAHEWSVHGQHDGAVASLLCARHELLVEPPVAIQVQLEPQRPPAGRPRNLLQTARGKGARHHDGARGPACPGRCTLPFGMRQPVDGRGRDQDRQRNGVAERCRAGVARAHVDQHPRPQPDFVVRGAVGAQRALVFAPLRVGVPDRRVHTPLRLRLVIVQIDGFHAVPFITSTRRHACMAAGGASISQLPLGQSHGLAPRL